MHESLQKNTTGEYSETFQQFSYSKRNQKIVEINDLADKND